MGILTSKIEQRRLKFMAKAHKFVISLNILHNHHHHEIRVAQSRGEYFFDYVIA